MRAAILYPGTRETRAAATTTNNRFAALFEAFAAAGIDVEPAVYHDEVADEVRRQLLRLDGVLVWVNPIHDGRDRSVLDALLREIAASGVFVSAHPDVILTLGTKETVYRTRAIGWSGDTHRYGDPARLRAELPGRLAAGARVLKRNRGNGGQGVWKVESLEGQAARVRVREATKGAADEEVPLSEFLARCDAYFARGGIVVDQAYQARLPEGMVRCYVVHDRVEGFGVQDVNALCPADPAGAPPVVTARQYHPTTRPEWQPLKARLEREWVPALQSLLHIERTQLPVLWDCDFLLGPKDADGADTYVLCEINVSSVAPFPESAIGPIVEATRARLAEWRARRASRV
jgi:hypothetical protein